MAGAAAAAVPALVRARGAARVRATPTSCTPTGCPSAVAGLATGKPLVLQAWGSDVELAKRLPWLFRPLLRRARVVVCASTVARRGRPRARRARRPRDPERRRPAGRGRVRPTSHRTSSTSAASRRRRASASSSRRRAACRSSSSATGRSASLVPAAVGFVPHDELGAVLRAGGRRLRPVAARGVRRRRARGDGATAGPSSRPASAASPTRSTTASRESSCRRVTPRRCARRSSGSSPTPCSGTGSERQRGRRREAAFAWPAATAATIAVYRDALAEPNR